MKKIFYKSIFTFTVFFLSFALFFPLSPVSAAVTHLVISQIQIAGVATTNDFVELYNPTANPIDINGYKLVKRTATGTTDTSLKAFSTTTFVPAFGYYLWANSGWSPSIVPDATTSASIASDNGVALRNGALDTGTIIDSVAWGSASNAFIEGSVFPSNPPAGSSIQRKTDETGGHGLDTNNNSSDFELLAVSSPRNTSVIITTPSSTPTATPTATPSPTVTSTPETTLTPTPTVSPTEIPTLTPTPTLNPTSTPTSTPTVVPSSTPSVTPTFAPTLTPTSAPKEKEHKKDHEDHNKEYSKDFHFGDMKIRCTVKYVFVHKHWFFGYYPEIQCTRR